MNVTLISNTHLRFLLERGFRKSLMTLWQLPSTLPRNESAVDYWTAIDALVVSLCDSDTAEQQQMLLPT